MRFPTTLDNTQAAAFRECPRKFELEYCRGLVTGESIDLIAGGAFAAACEATRRAFYEQKLDELDSLVAGFRALTTHYGTIDAGREDHVKAFPRLLDALLTYFGLLPLPARCTTLGVHRLGTDPYRPVGVEFSAVLPLPFTHPTSGSPLVYSIRFDALVESPYGLLGLDEKTGKQLDKNWNNKWGLRSQFLNYIKVCQLLDVPVKGMVTRGIILQKTQFHFPESVILPAQSVVDRCWDDTLHSIELMLHYYEQGYFPGAFNEACNAYGGCPYREICESSNPSSLYEYFDVAFWNPISAKREFERVRELSPMENPL